MEENANEKYKWFPCGILKIRSATAIDPVAKVEFSIRQEKYARSFCQYKGHLELPGQR